MPLTIEKLHLKVGKENDLRIKYSDFEKAMIKKLFSQGMSINGIAREIGCSKRLVQFTLFPERLAHSKELKRQRPSTYNREKNREYKRRYKKHLKELYKL